MHVSPTNHFSLSLQNSYYTKSKPTDPNCPVDPDNPDSYGIGGEERACGRHDLAGTFGR